ncbi:GNAT family N-acetyltransferase [Phytoactinopolyspora limicola]|uniref:GNAT family N-acetyltransferase n=1 Tax=Phytoactinopolyspora limicola TaxID=2715536 RepID=UPI00140C78D1|nr:GNAT family N-acetyltransferase [Phytoactinopolyspora limicola]
MLTVTLQPLREEHAIALLAFERENREYFARSIPDRGDAFFTEFTARLHDLLAEQAEGRILFHVIVDDEGQIVGRINLVDVNDGAAELGYRIGERFGGRGFATAAVTQVCQLAAETYQLTRLTAVTILDNKASLAVLHRTGFVAVGDIDIDGQPGRRFERSLVAADLVSGTA